MVADCPANCARWILCLANFVFIVSINLCEEESDLMTPFSFIAFFYPSRDTLDPGKQCEIAGSFSCIVVLMTIYNCHLFKERFFDAPTPISSVPAAGVCAVGCGL